MFLILYFVVLILGFRPSFIDGIYGVIFVVLTYTLYREYLRHHIAWARLNQRFYVQYLIDCNKVSWPEAQRLKKGIKCEKYNTIDKSLKEYTKRLFPQEDT
jgi:hypothetical protein